MSDPPKLTGQLAATKTMQRALGICNALEKLVSNLGKGNFKDLVDKTSLSESDKDLAKQMWDWCNKYMHRAILRDFSRSTDSEKPAIPHESSPKLHNLERRLIALATCRKLQSSFTQRIH